jgi:hypothetical protein
MSEVDHIEADRRARKLADEKVALSYRPGERQCMAAQLLWAREHRRQFEAFTRPNPTAEETETPPIREAFDLMADAYMGVFGMKNSPCRERVWAAMYAELANNLKR